MKINLVFAAALSGWLAAAAAAAAWAPTATAQRLLVTGSAWSQVTPSTDGAELIEAAIDIHAPARTVWMVMNDCGRMKRMVSSTMLCRTVEGDPRQGWDVREQITKGNFFVPTLRNLVRNDYQPFSLIRFHRVGGDLRIEEGEWRLEARDGGATTRVIYTNRVAIDILAPAALVRAGMRRDTAKVLVNLRRESVAAAHGGV